jgi:hypothetical protein
MGHPPLIRILEDILARLANAGVWVRLARLRLAPLRLALGAGRWRRR